ncbi:hypothetical protein ABK040_003665 [Willaertia magna]
MKLLFSILVVLFICLVIVPGSTYSFAKEDNTKEVQLPVPEFLEQLLESLENKINSTAQYVVNSLDDVLIRFVSHVATNEQLVDKLTEKVVDSLSNKKHEVLLGEIASTVIEKLIQDKFLDKVAHHLTSQVVMRMSEDKMKNNLQKVVSNSIDINSLVSTSLNSFFEAMNKPQNKEPIVEALLEHQFSPYCLQSHFQFAFVE